MKFKIGLYFAGFAFVLTFIVTRGKMIAGNVVFGRMMVNSAVFFAFGIGLEFLYKKFFAEKPEEKNKADSTNNENVSETEIAESTVSAGNSLDVTVGDDDLADEVAAQSSAEEPKEQTEQSFVPPPSKKSSGATEGKAKVEGDFIVYDDKKIPNDPKLIAQAIKTKLSDES